MVSRDFPVARKPGRWIGEADYEEAIRLYEKAGDLGCREAYSAAERLPIAELEKDRS